MQSETGFPSSH